MTDIITDVGEQKLAYAKGTGTEVAIKYIALGDGNGASYEPGYAQTALRNERARKEIESRLFVGGQSWIVKTAFPADTDSFGVREMGFFDAEGDLIAIWAGADVVPRQTGIIEYLVKHVLNFSRVKDGLVTVEAPDDVLISHMAVSLKHLAAIRLEQFNQAERLTALEG